jgi:hypothetical protein
MQHGYEVTRDNLEALQGEEAFYVSFTPRGSDQWDEMFYVRILSNEGWRREWSVTDGAGEEVSGRKRKKIVKKVKAFMKPYAVKQHKDGSTSEYYLESDILGNMPAVAVEAPCKPKKKKGETMRFSYDDDLCDAPTTSPAAERAYLSNRLSVATDVKDAETAKAFGLGPRPFPTSPEELVKLIQDGHFKFKNEETKDSYAYDPRNQIIWGDPELKEDRPGFEAALEKVFAARTDAMDIIATGTPAEGLAALKAFESKTFH